MGDLNECRALNEFFCKNRAEPLPIGSVKSNMGHAEISSGLSSILKVVATMRTDVIPANINSDPIDYTLDGIKDENLTVSISFFL